MKLELIALALGLLGTVGSVVTFLVYYPTEKRKRKADARVAEIQGDQASLEYLTKIKNEITKELEERIEKLEERVKTLEGEKVDHLAIIHNYKEAGKECHTCEGNTEQHPCPAITKYKELTK